MISATCLGALRGAPLRACLGALSRAAAPLAAAAATAAPPRAPPARALSSGGASNAKHSAIYLTDAEGNTVQEHTPLILGLLNYFERHLPFVGYFSPITGSHNAGSQHPVDRHLQLIRSVFEMKGDPRCAAAGTLALLPLGPAGGARRAPRRLCHARAAGGLSGAARGAWSRSGSSAAAAGAAAFVCSFNRGAPRRGRAARAAPRSEAPPPPCEPTRPPCP